VFLKQLDRFVSVTVQHGFLKFLVLVKFVAIAILDDRREIPIAKRALM
jgi:hypothetical protein